MSVLSHLEQVASALVLSSDEEASITTSIDTLEKRLIGFDTNSDIKTSYIFGSYERGTILPRHYDSKSDIDYMVVFNEPFKANPQTRLNWLKHFAEQKYPTSFASQDYPTIALELNHIRFELVPAVEMGGDHNLQIPAPHSFILQWINTNPSEIAQLSKEANCQMNWNFKPLVRILKLWNINNGRIYSSYQMENFLAQLVIFGNNLEEALYYAVSCLPTYGLNKTNRQKVVELQKDVKMAKSYHDLKQEEAAESIMKRLFPV